MHETQRKMLLYLELHRPPRDFMRGDRLAKKVGVSVNNVAYHYKKLRHRIQSRKGPYGGYRLIRE